MQRHTLQHSSTYVSEKLGFFKIKQRLPLAGGLEQGFNKIIHIPWIHPLKFSAMLKQKHARLFKLPF